ncbi:hypothetical protein ACWDY4_44895, partial [Streptomyces olivaceoviridis]
WTRGWPYRSTRRPSTGWPTALATPYTAAPVAAHHPATAAAVRRDLYVYALNGTEPEKDKLGEMVDTWPA